MILVLWSAVVSIAYAVLALAAPSAANVTVVAFIALLGVPATYHLIRSQDDADPDH